MAELDPRARHSASPAELHARQEAEREGRPFLLLRSPVDGQRLVSLDASRPALTVGRGEANAISLPWDGRVSRLHAELKLVAGEWVVGDDGLSRNGTFVNERRIDRGHRLRDGDVIRVGGTLLAFSNPADRDAPDATRTDGDHPIDTGLSPAQRRVLVSLCRPLKDAGGYAAPASNQEIADDLVLTVDSVKGHLRALFRHFDIEDLPQNRKRARLVELAFESGIISRREL